MSIQDATLAKAESVYDESLTMIVGLGNMNCSASLEFTVSSPNGPIDTSEFTREPSFVYLYVECNPNIGHGTYWETPTKAYNYSYSSLVQICLNMTMLDNPYQDVYKANALKRKFEDLLKIFLFYDEHLRGSVSAFSLNQTSTPDNGIFYIFLSEVPAVEELWNAFIRQEYSGFSELFSLNIRPFSMSLRLDKIGDQYWWTYQISGFGKRFPVSFNKEYTVSMNEILGHVGAISSAPVASSSDIIIEVYPGNGNWTFIPLETMPEMTKTQDTPERITFQTDIAGSSYNDIKLRFKIIESGNDLTTIYVAAAILGALSCIIGYYFLRRRRISLQNIGCSYF
jgi:hypothetical protein